MAKSLSQEDINFLRLAGLLIRVAPRAVRRKFDFEFHQKQLQQFLREKRGKIDDLTRKKRVITLTQYDLLYPTVSSKVSSDMFDVSLMVSLLKHFTDLDIRDSLPVETNHTVAADISRIKFYRNSIVHSESGKVNKHKFSEILKYVAEAILRLVPDIKSEIDALISSPLINASDMVNLIRLEKELETTNQHIVTITHKLETLETETYNIKELQLKTLREWRDTDKKYISTSATTFIVQSLNKIGGVIITGSPGCGKSAAAHHVAFELEKEGYEIIPCDDPSEIFKYFIKDKFQVFVIDDVCGKFSLNQQKADSWEQNDGKLNMLIESSNQNDDDEDNPSKPEAKFIITCRENIYVHKAFPKLTCFSLVQCNFSSDYKISPEEMRNIALSYLPINTVNAIQNICLYDFFPLICSLYCKSLNQDSSYFIHPVKIIGCEISEMKKKSEASFLCISLLVLRNNKFRKDELRCEYVQQLVKDICWDSKIESVSIVAILNSFERLKGVYITESDDFYTAIHDKMFDIISAAIAPSIIKCLIEHVDIAFLANRTHLSSFSQSSVPFVIHIPQEFESLYLKRQCQEAMKGKHWEVFGSIQTENAAYRKLLLLVLKHQESCQHISYDSGEDGNTPLINLDKTTALSATCLNGHTELAQLLLDNNADINITNKLSQDTLHFACLNGRVELVKLLLLGDYKVDITNKDTFGQTALHIASRNGHTETVQLLIEFGMNVNQKNKNGGTPLYLACRNFCYDTVKFLLDLNGQELNNPVDTSIKNGKGWSSLHVACSKGHIEIIKLLIDVGMNLNDTAHRNSTPLHKACQSGHYDTVKFLLDLNGQEFNSRVDTTIKHERGRSALHEACSRGHTEVVKLLIDVGMNLNDITNSGSTPLFLACNGGRFETMKYLLDLNGQTPNSRVDTTIKNTNGLSALHIACYNGHAEILKLLINVGMNINERNHYGKTAVHFACNNGHGDIVKILKDNCAELQTLDSKSRTPFMCAKDNGYSDIMKLLLE